MALPGKSLTRLRQVLAKIETTKGIQETLAAADAIPRIINPRFAFEPLRPERDVLRGNLAKLPKLAVDQIQCRMSFDVEMGGLPENEGSPPTFTAPAWGKLLSGCGFRAPAGMRKFDIGAVTGGPFRHQELITQTGSGATGNLIRDTYTGDANLYLDEASGTFNGTGLLTGSDSGATTTPSALAATVFGDHITESDVAAMKTLTMEMYLDGTRYKMRGAMGNVQFVFQHGRPGLFRFEFLGIFVNKTQAANVSGAYDTQSTPPVFHSQDMNLVLTDGTDTVQDGSANFQLSELLINMNNEVTLRDNSVALTDGLDFAIITNRAPSGSINPDEIDEAVYNFLSQLTSGDINRLDITLGQTSGNQFLIPMRGLQFVNFGDLDREGIFALDGSFDLTAGDYGSGVHGNDNEFMFLDT